MKKEDKNIGFAMCGSFCTFKKSIEQIQRLVDEGYNVYPIMSNNACSTDTRFGKAKDFINQITSITNNSVMTTIVQTEPVGPKKMFDALIICPCTGNTMAKLANAITDTSVTMAAKSHLRIGRPLIIAPATNDGLGASAQNIGKLINTKNIYFVPFSQDNYSLKPNSLVAQFDKLSDTLSYVLENNKQYHPVIS